MSLELDVLGMTCAACAGRVERALSRLHGVHSAVVNLALNRAYLRGGAYLTAADATAAIRRAGYEARAPGQDGDAAADRREDRRARRDLILAAVLTLPLLASMAVMLPGWAQAVLATPVLFWCGRGFFRHAVAALRSGDGTMDLLVVLGATAAWGISLWDLFLGTQGPLYFEGSAAVVTFVLFGKYLERAARHRAAVSIRALLALRPQTALRLRDGVEQQIPAAWLVPGDKVLVRPGDHVPVDGEIAEGEALVDESLLTGESVPAPRRVGERVIAGSLNTDGRLVVVTMAVGSETTLGRIARLVEMAQASKAPVQRLVDRISAIFVPIVVVIAVAVFFWHWGQGENISVAMITAVAVLVIACPCALGLATPAAILVGTGMAARHGILIRDAAALEHAAMQPDVIAFDKTGTLTTGKPALTDIVPLIGDEKGVLRLASGLQQGSNHPLAAALRQRAAPEIPPALTAFRDHAGQGVTGTIEGVQLAFGNARLMAASGIELSPAAMAVASLEDKGLTVSWLASLSPDPQIRAIFGFADTLRPDAADAVANLKQRGIVCMMLTGDSPAAAKRLAGLAGISDYRAGLLPEDKAAIIRSLRAEGRRVVMVGDGVNDAPALAEADLGIAMGEGTDAAMASAGIGLMRAEPSLVIDALDIARRTRSKIRQGLFWAFVYNVVALPLAAMGFLNPQIAGGAMALSSVSVVLNALSLRWWRPYAGRSRRLRPAANLH